MVKLSLIIPVYNVEKYIYDCIESCINQNLSSEKYEIIFVNDGSTDNSGKIINKYKEEYSNIILIEQENNGVSSARNNGLNAASGEYIWFIDSDDYIKENILLDIVNILDDYKPDKLEFEYEKVNGIKNKNKNIEHLNIVKSTNITNNMPDNGYTWKYIVRKELLDVNNIKFLEGVPMCEDLHFTFLLNIFAKKCFKTDEIIYYYRDRENSITKTYRHGNLKKYIDGRIIVAEFYKHYIENEVIKDNNIINLIKNNIDCDSQGAISLAISTGDVKYCKTVLSNMKNRDLYPYKILWKNIIPKHNIKKNIINICALLFPYESYVLLCCNLYKQINHIRSYIR